MKRALDAQLVHRAQRGDKAAFAELFTRYESHIFGYLYRMVGDRAWAEDLAQEAFIQAHQHLGRLGPPYDFKSWVYRIASNLALDGLRRYRYEVALPDWDSGETTAPEPADQRREGDPERQARLTEVRAAVWRTLHQLPDNYRQILTLRELDGLSYGEIATVLGISLDNVRVTLHRARLQFRALYGLQMMMEEGRLACQELNELLSAYMDSELGRAGRKRVKTHVAACPVCQKTRRDLLTVSSLLAALAPVFPPPTLHTRFPTRLKHLPPPQAPPPSGVGGRPPGRGEPPRSIAGLAGRGTAFWLPLGLGAGAVTLLIAAAVLGLLILPRLGTFAVPTSTPTPTTFVLPTGTSTVTSLPPSPTLTPTSTATPMPTPLVPTATPRPWTATPTPPPTPAPRIAFWADATTVQAGTCTTIHWETEHVQAVFFDGQGVVGVGSHRTCPCVTESHTLDVLLPDGNHDVRTLTIRVNGTCAIPTPTSTSPPTYTPTPDTQPPPAPAPIAPVDDVVLSCRSSATLSWSAVSDPSGVAGYYVKLEQGYRGEKWYPIGEWGPLSTTQQDVPVSCGFSYRWIVQAEDGAGNRGPWSEWAQFGIGVDEAKLV